MIPDKIFIDEDLIAFHVLQTKYDGDIEYIRKDALLNKLNFALKLRDDGNPNSNNDGIQTIKAIINYIESL